MPEPSGRAAATGFTVAVAAVVAVTVAIFGLREIVPVQSTAVVYLLAVLLVSSRFGLGLGIFSALLSTAAFNFFHIPPTGRFSIAEGENWLGLAVFFVAAIVASTLAGRARARAEEADRRRREADLTAEMARALLSEDRLESSLPLVGRRIAQTFGLDSVGIELGWRDSGPRQRGLPLIVDGSRAATVLVPADAEPVVLDAVQDRVLPALETLVAAARRRQELETQVGETRALRRSNVVKTTLLRAVSHDLRSPLTAIRTAAEGLRSPTISDAERVELVEVVAEESERLEHLVDDLLDLTRLESGAVEPNADWCDVREVVDAAVSHATAPPGGFSVEVEDELPMVRADAAQLERALANVLDNAVRFAGGEPVVVRGRAAPSTVVLRITDRGPGIPAEQLSRIFEPFHRVDEGGTGAGLGLAIARGFVEANGGQLRAESLPGQGTSFVLQLPLPVEATAGRPSG